MERRIIVTADGSNTVEIPEKKVAYHSHHGAVQESQHVFLNTGLLYQLSRMELLTEPLRLFEMGFGTGLNAFLTAIMAEERKIKIHYTTIELFPLSAKEIALLNYTDALHHQQLFQQLHQSVWEEDVVINPFFTIRKANTGLASFISGQPFHLIYFDAFAPSYQPELWTEEVFKKLFEMTAENGVLVTYCSKSVVRRAMQAAGYTVTKPPGPWGKREMVRAEKLPLAPTPTRP